MEKGLYNGQIDHDNELEFYMTSKKWSLRTFLTISCTCTGALHTRAELKKFSVWSNPTDS